MNNNPRQVIGFRPAVSATVANIISSDIFMKPASMAAQLASPYWLIAVWIIAGAISVVGALIFSEIGAMIPRTGGIYIYLRQMYGDFVAFLYGWAGFTVINTASVSAIAFVCAAYSDYFLHMPRLSPALRYAGWYGISRFSEIYIPWQIWVLNPSRSSWYWE